jgi:hypothetical protein
MPGFPECQGLIGEAMRLVGFTGSAQGFVAKTGGGRGVADAHLTCRVRLRSPASRVCYGGEFQSRSVGHASPPARSCPKACALPCRLRAHGFAAGSQNRCVAGWVGRVWGAWLRRRFAEPVCGRMGGRSVGRMASPPVRRNGVWQDGWAELGAHGFAAGSQNRCVAGWVGGVWGTVPHITPATPAPIMDPPHGSGTHRPPDKGGSGVWSGRPNGSGIHRWRRPAGAP